MAVRAVSSGLTAEVNSGRSAISSLARTAKTLNVPWPTTRPRFLSRPRTWFSRSRLIDQQRPAREQCLDSVAIKVLDAHFLEPAGLHDACDAAASLGSFLLTCIFSTAF